MNVLKVFSDGGARGNPGPAALGYIVYLNEEEIHSDKKYLGEATNNIAEYNGLLEAITWVSKNCERRGVSKIIFHLDSELVVKQMKGEYKIKNSSLFEIAQKIKAIEKSISADIEYLHVKRADNKEADLLVNQMLDSYTAS